MAKKLDTYPVLRLQQLGTIAVIQPLWDGEVAGPSLTVDLETGSVALAEHPKVEKDYSVVHGVLGLARLEAGPALVVITGAEEVGVLLQAWRRGWQQSSRHEALRLTGARSLVRGSGVWTAALSMSAPAFVQAWVGSADCGNQQPQPSWRQLVCEAEGLSSQVAELRGHPVYKVTATQVLADSNNRQWKDRDHRCDRLSLSPAQSLLTLQG